MIPAGFRGRRARLIARLARPLRPILAVLFDNSGSGTLTLDRDGRIVRTNRRVLEMLAAEGLSPAPYGSPEALFAPADRSRVAITLVAALSGDPAPPLQVRLAGRDPASAAVVTLSMAALRESDGPVTGLVLRLIDVSAEKRHEGEQAQLQKLQAMGRLAGGIAHDFNNLLTAIGAAADSVLEREDTAPATQEDARQICQSVDRGAALVRQLLAFGRRQPLLPAVVAVNAAIRNLSEMLARLLGERVRLHLELEEPGRSVHVDPSQFDQVLVNLAVNARDAMPVGGTLTLRTGHLTMYRQKQIGSEAMPPGRYVAITVQDTGVGIPEATLAKVFEPFFTTRREHGGTGLGLSTVHGIVRQSGGFVTVESEVGRGTIVRIWLPRHEMADAVSTAPQSGMPPIGTPQGAAGWANGPAPVTGAAGADTPPVPAPPSSPRGAAGRRILLVEDEEPVRRLTERALQRAGWQVSTAESAEAALQCLPHPSDPAGPPQVLVSDIILPGMDGTDLVRAVRAVWPDLPAVLVSGYTDSALLGDLASQGVAFMAKPFRLQELIACVERVVA